MPIAFSLGSWPSRSCSSSCRGVARHRHAERLRGDGEHHAAVDPALHPEGRGDRQVAGRARSLSRVARVDEQGSRRTRHRQRVRVRAVRGDGRLEPGDVLGDRQRGHSGDAAARLFGRLRRRHHRGRRHARHPAAAVDHDDPLRRRGGTVARPAVPRRHRPGRAAGRAVRALRRLSLPQGTPSRVPRPMRRTAPSRPTSTTRSTRRARNSRCCRGSCRSSCC